MEPEERYARKIAGKYGVDLAPDILDQLTGLKEVGQIARVVLPQSQLDQWYDDEMKYTNDLRAGFGMPLLTEAEQPRPVSKRR